MANPKTPAEVLKKYETREVPLQRRLQEVLGYGKQDKECLREEIAKLPFEKKVEITEKMQETSGK